jgi:hypothetical protein
MPAVGADPAEGPGGPPSARTVVLVGLSVVFAVLALSSGEVRVAALLLFGVVCVSALRFIDHRTQLSFGQGFIGYRADGWPVGVQEDDDLHWSWQSSRGAASDTDPELEIPDRR